MCISPVRPTHAPAVEDIFVRLVLNVPVHVRVVHDVLGRVGGDAQDFHAARLVGGGAWHTARDGVGAHLRDERVLTDV